MRVFITGGSGWIGSQTVDELTDAGHDVVALARSDASATALEAKGATVLRGDLDDLDSLRLGAAEADGVIHLANKHDFANPAVSNLAERGAVQTFLDTLEGTDKPLVLAAGVAGLTADRPAVESDVSSAVGPESPRGGSENLALSFAERGVRAAIVRFAPTVHGMNDPQFIRYVADAARRTGVSGYVGDGAAAWAACHRDDTARLLVSAVQEAPAGSVLHAIAEEGVATKAIAEALGEALGLPAASIPAGDAAEHFGFVGRYFALDLRASGALTQERYDWSPAGPTLLQDIAAGAYGTA